MVFRGFKLFLKGAKKQSKKFDKEGKVFLERFKKRLTEKLYHEIKKDKNPTETINSFAEELGFEELECKKGSGGQIRRGLLDQTNLKKTVECLCESKFVYQLAPVFCAISWSVREYKKLNIKEKQVDQLLAAPLEGLIGSNAIDSIIDRDEYLNFLDYFKLIGAYSIKLARADSLESGGEVTLKLFEEGLKDANIGQHIDKRIKERIEKNSKASITYSEMEECYRKYNPVGVAAKMQCWNEKDLEDIFYVGGASLGKEGGIIDDFQDTLEKKRFDNPSWQSYFLSRTKDVEKSLEYAFEQGKIYGERGKMTIGWLPHGYSILPYLEGIFWYLNRSLKKEYKKVKKQISIPTIEKQFGLS
jgi:hypothetical protein